MSPRALAWALLGLGFVAGALFDRRPALNPPRVDGRWVLEGEFHAHTRFSDGFLSPVDLVTHARRRGLDVLAVTEHNLLFPAELARAWSRATRGPTVIVGEEVTSRAYHVLAYGLRETVAPRRDLNKVIDAVHAQGGLVFAAHPVRRFWRELLPARARLDGAELMHPIAYELRRGGGGWRWGDMREYFVGARAQGRHFTPLGASDYHFFSPLGLCRTVLHARERTEAGVMEALREGRVVVFDREGRAYGDEALARSLRAAGWRPRPQDDNYRGEGTLDRVTRALGLLGAVGLLLLRRR